jgi:hypothetical protein
VLDLEMESLKGNYKTIYVIHIYILFVLIQILNLLNHSQIIKNYKSQYNGTYYDIESIDLLKPKTIVVVYEKLGGAGSKDFHRWLKYQTEYNNIAQYCVKEKILKGFTDYIIHVEIILLVKKNEKINNKLLKTLQTGLKFNYDQYDDYLSCVYGLDYDSEPDYSSDEETVE